MDADLEAILAESDSDDGLGAEGGLSLEDILKEDGASSPLQEYRAPQANEESYSARDWAVLQQILREDDDDDDVVPEPPPSESPLQKHQEKPQAAPVVEYAPTAGATEFFSAQANSCDDCIRPSLPLADGGKRLHRCRTWLGACGSARTTT